MITLPLKSGFLHESLPYLQVSSGLTALGTIENGFGQLFALILLITGGAHLWRKRKGLLPVPSIPRACSPDCATGGQCSRRGLLPAPLVWRNSFNIGHTDIDARHRGLFSIANGLLESIAANESESTTDPAMDALIERVAAYFMAKEAAFATGERKLTAQQRATHDTLIEAMEERRHLYRLGKISRNELAGFITHDVIAANAISTCFESTFQQGAWAKQQCHRHFTSPRNTSAFRYDTGQHAEG